MRIGVLHLCTLGLLVLGGCGKVVENNPDAAVDGAVDADPCATASCECTAATEATDCGAHEICDESGPGRVCACAPAYEDQNGSCVFAGAPLDPGLQDGGVWGSLGAGAVIDPAAVGNIDAGEGVIDRVGMCAFSGLSQTFTMPPRDRAEPFKLVVTHTAVDMNFELGAGHLAIGVGSQWFELPASRNVYRTDTVCLGPSAYGGAVDFRIATFGSPSCAGTSTATLRVDQVMVQPAAPGECPEPGVVVNGTFEAAGEWDFVLGSSATGAIVPGVGENNTAGARLAAVNRCSEARMTGTIALPAAAMEDQAIEVFWSGTSGGRLAVSMGGKGMATLNANGQAKKTRICVPAWARGTTTSLSFFMQRISNNGCNTTFSRTFTIDNIAIVNEPACASTGALTDPGFERIANTTGPTVGWELINDIVNDVQGGIALAVNSAGEANTGNGFLRLTASNECASEPSATASFVVPPASGSSGPAVKFSANVAANTTTTTEASLAVGFLQEIDLPENAAWGQHVLCVPPALAGRPVELRLAMRHSDGGQSCLVAIPTDVALFDDVEITTDASCPAQ